ncbi:hypothetical protein [Methylobacterium sp. JK268]
MLPFTNDLGRLAASAALEAGSAHFHFRPEDAADALLEGDTAHLRVEADPFIPEDRHGLLRDLALATGGDAHWRKQKPRRSEGPEAWEPVPRRTRQSEDKERLVSPLPSVHTLAHSEEGILSKMDLHRTLSK